MEFISLSFILLLIAGGAVAGLFVGLLGIGGSVLLVPLQFYLLTELGYPPDIAIKTAIATALFFTLPTSLNSAYSHSKRNNVLWKKALFMGIFGFLFSFIGASIASYLNAAYLSVIFGVVVLGASLKFTSGKGANEDPQKAAGHPLLYALCGSVMGLIAGLTGIGGGLILVPLLVFWLNVPFRQAIGTSSATIILTASGGAVSYVINGIGVIGLPPYSVGYINLIIWISLVIPGILFAGFSARNAYRVNQKYVRILFSAITFLVGIGMILKGLGF
ncbi:MAG: sulfite exporter TauE/SafE family protein [Methanimicrococcus sp.]|nr:sulfite exporter TauE/SafE family protein [Methanimicrococcus sp.]